MKRLAFVTIGLAALTLAACNKGNQDAVQNAELNQPETDQLNELANQAAMDAAENQAAAQNQINKAVNEQNAAIDNTVNPQEADEQNVSGM
jgi:polyhydroxyalkanoate synthesis regulator phasin